jgi:hypothetical protein
MKKINLFFSLFLLLITACNKQENVTTGNNIQNGNNSSQTAEIDPDTGCQTRPGNLTNAEEINLEETVKKSGQLTAGKYLGYTFEGKQGQILNYSTPNNICLWIFQPDMQLLDGVELPIDGKYTVQITIPEGSSTFELEMGLNKDNLAYNSSLNDEMSQEEALNLVQRWYEAKPTMFNGGFHQDLVAELATGELYDKTTKSGGSMDWLQQNGCYYTYDYSNIDYVISFDNQGSRPSLRVKVSEKLTLHGSRSAGCNGRPKSYSKPATYWFEKENGIWKIYNYDVE